MARALVDAAADAGADAVKFQTYSGADLYSSRTPRFQYLDDDRSPQELLDAIALPREWQPLLAEHAAARGIHFFSSPFDRAAVDSLAELGVPAMKIASFELVDVGLVEYTAATGIPIIISTGMATYGEVEDALAAVARSGNRQVALLRCASLYPAPAEIMNLRAMATMRAAFGVPVGLSDHTTAITVAAGAAALGMAILEKHMTLDRGLEGPDHPFALEPGEMQAMIAGVREVEAALGNGRLEGPSEPESGEMYRNARRSIVAACAIAAGTQITAEMLTVKRPGFGIVPKHLPLVVGRIAKTDIPEDEIVTWEMV
ncbi:MAG: N-acetylneuraminate synthase family protein [Solirubrobacterales bacterium]|nr:N-acetylneuraminate synthase family protein [Solirubrobacterales bacterium]